MKNILKKHDISLRLLSLLLSVVLWAVVMDMDNPERPRTFDNIPVRISGATVLQQQTGLSLIEGADSTVKITLRGPQRSVGLVILDKAILTDIRVGDQIAATYEEAMLVSITPPAPPAPAEQ